jgi:hypothetical protein
MPNGFPLFCYTMYRKNAHLASDEFGRAVKTSVLISDPVDKTKG